MNATKVICLTTNKIFNTINEASIYYNCSRTNISMCCNKKRKHCGKLSDGTKLQWMHYENYLKQQLIHNKNLVQVI